MDLHGSGNLLSENGDQSVNIEEARDNVSRLIEEVKKAIIGKDEVIKLSVICLLAKGHLLIDDIPGVGKTTLAKALAKAIGGIFKRIQFTPDLLPSDITGGSIYDPKESKFIFKPGPIFANIVLADEINRASPRTQASLLESMEEHQVTADGVSYKLPEPFIVIATENRVEHYGIYPLPEAQIDRFMMRLSLGYPEKESEEEILRNHKEVDDLAERVERVVDPDTVVALQGKVKEIYVSPEIQSYIVDLVWETRRHPAVSLGASPRVGIHLQRCAQAFALSEGRDFVLPDDVKFLIPHILGHRLILKPERRVDVPSLVKEIVEKVPVPLIRR
ncbi:MoxR family ATPase [bacterium]|nr:MoxR family ATPase [bacterium]